MFLLRYFTYCDIMISQPAEKEVFTVGKREEIGKRIRVMRKSRGMTQEDLARSIEQSPSSITMYETGRREPDLETLEALADVFNVTLGSIVSGETRMEMPIYIPDTEKYTKVVRYMSDEDYENVVNAFKHAYQRMLERGISID